MSPESVLSQLNHLIVSAAHNHIGKTKLIPRKTVPWWNVECAEALRKSKRAFNVWKRKKSQDSFIEFKKLRAQTRLIIKRAKQNSWISFVSTLHSNTPTKVVWDRIKRIKGNTYQPGPAQIISHGSVIDDNQGIANLLAQKFETASSNANCTPAFLSHKNQVESSFAPPQIDSVHPLNNIFSLEELENALQACPNSAAGPDDIPFIFLQNLPCTGKVILLNLYNDIWTGHSFPELWSEAIIIPILKPNKPKFDVNSYRPISLTCTMCKLMEKMINRRLVWYLEKEHLLNIHQSGFRKLRSTADNIINLESEIREAFANRHKVLAVFFDIEKAYDMTWRHKILDQLLRWELTGNIYFFVFNFLHNRTFSVRVNNTLSRKKNLQNGIPQGSVLSVTLFLIAINDILKDVNHPVKGGLFADDLILYIKGKELQSITSLLQRAIHTVQAWSENNGVRFSAEKTKCICFSQKSGQLPPPLQLQGINLDYVPQAKFLGVVFDQHLSWKPHIDHLKATCLKIVDLLKVLSHPIWGADTQILLRIYRTLLRPKLDYGAVAYSACRPRLLTPLITLQNSALRIALGAFRTSPVISLYSIAKEPPLLFRFKYLQLSFAANTSRNPSNPVLQHVFTDRLTILFDRKRHLIPPISIRLQQDLVTLGIPSFPAILPYEFATPPPWLIPSLRPDTTLLQFTKTNTPASVIQTEFHTLQATCSDSTFLYTDASKSVTGVVGSAVVGPSVRRLLRLPSPASVFTGELYALLQACKIITTMSASKYCICTDSLASLSALRNIYSTNPLIMQIFEVWTMLSNSGKTVRFIFVPSHTGISGNEEADRAAKEAVESESAAEILLVPAPDAKSLFKQAIIQKWQTDWTSTPTALQQIKPEVNGILPLPPDRRDQVVLTRLRLGHTRLTHGYLLNRTSPATCQQCGCRQTVQHLICDCPHWQTQRNHFQISPNLAEALGSTIPNVVNILLFLKHIKLFECI
ncbi:hypothetical protein Zmor_002258 [Zophobas morio]|uniref:RNA-directed DNA polymerase from mobile element jockey n=1 Tax=Zophobas morio TaxID=2755281 RepID=A0AA38J4C6_9CUCU|nr:hypothetical protein Zmor_002258 [Zophobas morio]